MELKFDYLSKLDILKNIRHSIKKKKFILDENYENFGFDALDSLKSVKNTSEIKGYPFVASKNQSKILKGTKMGIKIIPSELKYEKFEHPTDLEIITLKELTDNVICKNISPHFVFYLGTQKISNKSKAVKFLNLKRLEVEEFIRKNSSILLSEYVEGGSLDNWIRKSYDNSIKISEVEWKNITFQLIYTIAIMQKKYKMMHNDFHYGNILIDNTIKPGGYFVYEFNNKKFINLLNNKR